MNPFLLLFRCRHILYATTLVDIRSRYSGTVFGLGWMILYPFLFLGIYAVVYSLILRVRLPQYSSVEYILLIFAGLIPFIGFSDALSTTAVSVSNSKQLIKNTLFPIELVPVKAVLTSSPSMAVGVAGLMVTLWIRGEFHIIQILILPLLFLQMIFSIGIGWILSAINVLIRDTAQAIGIFVLVLMVVSPIAYTRDMIPHQMLLVAYVNPLFYIIELYRQVLVYGIVSWRFWLALVIMAGVTFAVGYRIFQRLKPTFAEYV